MPFRPSRRAMLGFLAGLGLAPGTALSQGARTGARLVAQNGTLLVKRALLMQGPGGRLLVRVRVPETSAAILGPGTQGAAQRLLRRMASEGRAAGNHGDLYENRDRGHSPLPQEKFPQLTHIEYDEELRAERLDYGLAGPVLFDAPLIGNSSTALKHGPFWRSQPRLALTQGQWLPRLYQNYIAGQMHVYPEHRDHDPEHGDLIPAATPFFVISQGSSYSDQPHVRALAMAFAALRPETKAFLRANQLLAPTVQMILRRSLAPVRAREDYRSGLAHPSVLPREQLNPARMVKLANALTPETVPPMVRLAVLSETEAAEGVDFFGEGLSERFFDTPVAIARVWRSFVARRSMVVSAEATRDPAGRSPQFHWRVLRGDPDRTRVEPLDARGLRARITVDWQPPRPVPGRRDILSNRVDIGVFATNGAFDSMPGLISILLPQHETRVYAPGPDGVPRIVSRDLAVPEGGYADPFLYPRAEWRDVYRRDDAGEITGWDREGPDGTTRFDAAGRLITPDGPVAVRHVIEREPETLPRLVLRRPDAPAAE